jgi:hypothetical protein
MPERIHSSEGSDRTAAGRVWVLEYGRNQLRVGVLSQLDHLSIKHPDDPTIAVLVLRARCGGVVPSRLNDDLVTLGDEVRGPNDAGAAQLTTQWTQEIVHHGPLPVIGSRPRR